MNKQDRLISILFTIAIILSIFFIFKVVMPFSEERQEITKIYHITEDKMIYGLDDEEKLEILEDTLEIIPDKYLDKIQDKQWKIIIVEEINQEQESIQEDKPADDAICMGTAKLYPRLIYLQDTDIKELKEILLHEFAHAIDFTFEFSSKSDFYNMYKDYKEKGYIGYNESKSLKYATRNEKEFFATVFKDLLLYPNYLKENAPDVYNYLQKIIYERELR